MAGESGGQAGGQADGPADPQADGPAGGQPDWQSFPLRGEHITLDALLKATGLAASGGAAKLMIASGQVQIDGLVELRRGRKLRGGEQVVLADSRIKVVAAGAS